MTDAQKRRFHIILDSYDRSMATINTADENALEVFMQSRDLLHRLEGMIESTQHILSNNKIIMEANRIANEQVRILLNEL